MPRSGSRDALPDASARRAGLLHLSIVYVVWGSTYLAIRIAVRPEGGFPPFALGSLRMLLAGGVLLGWAAIRGTRVALSRRDALTLAAAGLLMLPLGNGLVNWAERRADSGYAALLVGSLPIWTAVIESALDRRRPTLRLALSLAIGFGGLVLLVAPGLVKAGAADAGAIVALLVAPITWALGSVLQTRRPVSVGPVVSAGYLHLFGAAGFLMLFLILGEAFPHPSAAAWGAFAYLVLAGSVGAFTSFVRVLRLLPTSVVMTYAYVNPVIAVVLGAIFLRERVTWIDAAGMALVLLGVWGVLGERFGRGRALRGEEGEQPDSEPFQTSEGRDTRP
ncbi:MAG: EamA family transporter [Candidatus Bipolaricaulota bacterium]|nr:EamA family transporter [Candidatus Bipolaricaulota bacterium]